MGSMDSEIPLPPPPRRLEARTKPARGSPSAVLSRADDCAAVGGLFCSSDPAFFSSDDIPASGLENYSCANAGSAAAAAAAAAAVAVNSNSSFSNSRKRLYQGTWWGAETGMADARRKRVDFKDKRHHGDSGVWMGSDESLAESFLLSDEQQLSSTWHESGPRTADNNIAMGLSLELALEPPPEQQSKPAQTRPVSGSNTRAAAGDAEPPEYQLARRVVHACLEHGEDSVDLSNICLGTVPADLLRPLELLTKSPPVKELPVSEEAYTPLQPFLRLFLFGCALTAVPGELFELDNLRVLSLRNNNVTEIPPAIRRLTMLQELNLSVNQLSTLPWELLWLIRRGDLKLLVVHPNPLLRFGETDVAQWHYANHKTSSGQDEASCLPTTANNDSLRFDCYDGPPPEESWAPIHIATSAVRFLSMDGLSLSLLPPHARLPCSSEECGNATGPRSCRVPSLRELALLGLSQSSYLDQMQDFEMQCFPELTRRLLRLARDVRLAGGRCCSVCHRSFVVARTEWLEWWDCSTYENGLKQPRRPGELLRPLPFRRLGCSWACVPGTDTNSVE